MAKPYHPNRSLQGRRARAFVLLAPVLLRLHRSYFADKNGNPVRATSDPNDLAAKFYIRLQTGSSIPATIPGETSARILWLIIPARGAGGAVKPPLH